MTAGFCQFNHNRGEELDPGNLAKQILKQPGNVGISTMINSLPFVLMAARLVKATDPSRVIVLGGAGMNGISKKIVECFEQVDFVCFGEGEEQVVPLLKFLCGSEMQSQIPAVSFRVSGGVNTNAAVPRVVELDRLPLPRFDLISLQDYQHVPVMGSRGCPLKCQFCDVAPSWGRRNTSRSPGHVVNQLKQLSESYGVRRVTFVDDLFTLNKRWVKEFCHSMRSEACDVSWRANSHVNFLSEELLETMVLAGCEGLFFGVESGSDKILSDIQKNFSAKKAQTIVSLAQNYVKVSVNLMWGFPSETITTMEQTLALRSEFERNSVETSLVMLAPLSLAPILRGSQIIFSEDVPNIFLQDYHELAVDYRREWKEMIVSHPGIFGAFYHFNNKYMDDLIDRVEADSLMGFILKSSENGEAWKRL